MWELTDAIAEGDEIRVEMKHVLDEQGLQNFISTLPAIDEDDELEAPAEDHGAQSSATAGDRVLEDA